jgi:hypothetical protein
VVGLPVVLGRLRGGSTGWATAVQPRPTPAAAGRGVKSASVLWASSPRQRIASSAAVGRAATGSRMPLT